MASGRETQLYPRQSGIRGVGRQWQRRLGLGACPPGRHFSTREVRGYFLDYTQKTDGTWGSPQELRPADAVQLAFGWWERNLEGESGADVRFLAAAEQVLRGGERAGDALLFPYDIPLRKFRIAGRWHSALAQGQAASVFTRAYLHTGEARWADAAVQAVAPLLPAAGELVTATAQGPVLQEAPSTPPSHILNGWISALWGLWDVAAGVGDTRAREAFQAGAGTLRAFLPAYDVGWWTRYSLFPGPLEDLAKPEYHTLHCDQLEIMAALTSEEEFRRVALRWRGYDVPARRALVLAHKAAFALSDRRRRRALALP